MAIIWTKHAIERNNQRKISKNWVEGALNSPDQFFQEEEGKTKYVKDYGKQTVSVITAKTDKGERLILSAWIDPPNLGTQDYKNEEYRKGMKKAGNLKKFWITLLHQIGF